ncbi:hypothetical protein AB4Y36_10185 [Paraburkholderia sp. BR10936]|uniref:hypothetical protein n=1 Tax=Paraburkholderia sp. BR10936 TaxID=3236993 RepID=UPI0034D32823
MALEMRRIEHRGVLTGDSCKVLAYAPERYRRYLKEIGRLVDGEYVWCFAYLSQNRKSLAPFFASGDAVWPVPPPAPEKIVTHTLTRAQFDALAAACEVLAERLAAPLREILECSGVVSE